MALENLLGNLGDFGSQPIGMPDPAQQQADIHAMAPTLPNATHPGFFAQLGDPHSGVRHGLADFLGNMGDFLLQANGHAPMYAPRKQQQQLSAAVANFLGPNSGLDEIARRDPNAAIQLWASMRKPELPADIQDFQYEQNLPPDKRVAFERFMQFRYPNMMSPIALNQGDQVIPSGGATPAASSAPTPDAPAILKQATARGYVLPGEMQTLQQSLGPNGQGAMQGWLKQNSVRVVTRTGMKDGRPVVQFDDGTVDYAH